MSNAGEPPTWTDLWARVTEQLGDSEEARRILEQASGRSGAAWLVMMSSQATPGAVTRVQAMIDRRLAGEPLQYVLGSWSFRKLNLHVDKRVLIPRPETEQVTEVAIQVASQLNNPVIVDLGTGSGAIALSIASEVTGAHVYATDVSEEALAVAQSNFDGLSDEVKQRVRFVHGSWFDALPVVARGAIDIVISNPPYVAESERDEVEAVVTDWEPTGALFSGLDGLDDIRVIVGQAAEWLKQTGSLIIELAPNQAETVTQLARESGFTNISIGKDFAGRERWIHAQFSR